MGREVQLSFYSGPDNYEPSVMKFNNYFSYPKLNFCSQEVTNVKVNGDHKETGRGILSEQETWYRDSSQMYGAVHGGLRVSLGRTRWRDSRSRQE
jgi:hypothetical protein